MKLKRIIAPLVTVGLLAAIFWKIDRTALGRAFSRADWTLFAAAMGLFIPQIAAIAWRWRVLVSPFAPLSYGESARLVLASNTLNLVLPSKAGDLTKGWFLARGGTLDLPRAMGLVVFEKMLDVATLAAFMAGGAVALLAGFSPAPQGDDGGASVLAAARVALAVGAAAVGAVATLYFVPPAMVPGRRALLAALARRPGLAKIGRLVENATQVVELLQSRGAGRAGVVAWSVAIWFLHLGQIWLFMAAVGVRASAGQFLSLAPLAIFVGLIPISVAGFGPRDQAFLVFFAAWPKETVLAAALFINLRYIVPAAAGLPFLRRYLAGRAGMDSSDSASTADSRRAAAPSRNAT